MEAELTAFAVVFAEKGISFNTNNNNKHLTTFELASQSIIAANNVTTCYGFCSEITTALKVNILMLTYTYSKSIYGLNLWQK